MWKFVILLMPSGLAGNSHLPLSDPYWKVNKDIIRALLKNPDALHELIKRDVAFEILENKAIVGGWKLKSMMY